MGQSLRAAGSLTVAASIARGRSIEDSIPGPCLPEAWRKHGVVLEAPEPWEEGQIQNFTSCVDPLESGRFRLWFSSGRRKNFSIGWADGRPGERFEKVIARCTTGEPADAPFAIGNLPEEWKPTQVVHI